MTHRIISSIQAGHKKQVPEGVFLADASKEFVLKWNFYSGLILRELTMKSANSFGTFHLLKILLDEYIYHIIETKMCDSNELPEGYSAPGGF